MHRLSCLPSCPQISPAVLVSCVYNLTLRGVYISWIDEERHSQLNITEQLLEILKILSSTQDSQAFAEENGRLRGQVHQLKVEQKKLQLRLSAEAGTADQVGCWPLAVTYFRDDELQQLCLGTNFDLLHLIVLQDERTWMCT